MKIFIKLSHRLREYIESCKDDPECCFTEDSYWHILHGYALAVHEYMCSYSSDTAARLTQDDVQIMLEEMLELEDGDGLDEELVELWKQYTDD